MSAHVTLLPPRLLSGTEASALQTLDRICGEAEPFDVDLGNVESFVPTTPTVYIRLTGGSARMRELHDQLNTQALAFREEWPYVPHMTIAKMAAEPDAQEACRVAGERWSQYAGSRRIRLERLTFVREEEQGCWVDLAPVTLGANLVPH
jgi:2'-5' RNA ligase